MSKEEVLGDLTKEQLEYVVGGGCGNDGDPDGYGKPGAPTINPF